LLKVVIPKLDADIVLVLENGTETIGLHYSFTQHCIPYYLLLWPSNSGGIYDAGQEPSAMGSNYDETVRHMWAMMEEYDEFHYGGD